MLALLLFGGETLKDFAFALLVGTISGTYSSVFIAAPVLTHWKEREPVYRTRERRIREELGYVPAYAVPIGGAPVDVAPAEPRGGRRGSPRRRTRRTCRGRSSTRWSRDLGIEEAAPAREPGAAARPPGRRSPLGAPTAAGPAAARRPGRRPAIPARRPGREARRR